MDIDVDVDMNVEVDIWLNSPASKPDGSKYLCSTDIGPKVRI